MPATIRECLPEHLRERIRPLAERAPDPDGAMLIYWMHHAVRAHENPALDTALHVACALDIPLLVYQGLGGGHRFDSDRHHAFILEGAADAHAALAARGVRAVFHLPRDPRAPSPLPALAARAALVVTEEFPAPPFPGWARRLAERIRAPVWAVDCACIVPMQLQPKAFARAFEFRRHNAAAYRERMRLPWPETDLCPAAYDGDLAFTPQELDLADIPALCAECHIDHTLPPVPDTPGGSAAGYARWDAFKRERLGQYHRRRNDAADPAGVSRLSPYLHHGHVSALRIAREAAAHGGEGAEKFLDELSVWRELAHNHCFFAQRAGRDPAAIEGLPQWARQTLADHAGDPRPRLIDAETLQRGRTGDTLWDSAQRSLLVHGELQNNLRMTWAKALPFWAATPRAALSRLVDLNHRHALDGSDPNSYGGLLWALGLFDRPFAHERPVTGRLRTRATQEHANRLDTSRFARMVDRPASGRRLRIAVVGAGLSGLAAARTLSDQCHDVVVFEKSRGRGGRAATRRIDGVGGQLGVDHGAQYFTARDPRFRRRVLSWAERGIVAQWEGRFGAFDGQHFEAVGGDHERWVGVPGMSAIGRDLADELDLRLGVRLGPPLRDGTQWRLVDDGGTDAGRFDRVLISAPAPQAAALLQAAPALAARAAGVAYAPCWSVMLGFDQPPRIAFDGLFVNAGPLRWIANDATKPDRDGCRWVLHAHPQWTTEHLDAAPEAVIAALCAAFEDLAGGALPTPRWTHAHRWLYALVQDPLADGCLWDAELGIGACGDWCNGARIEGAWLSGEAIAGRLLCDAARRAG
jgi:photolyase PhrII